MNDLNQWAPPGRKDWVLGVQGDRVEPLQVRVKLNGVGVPITGAALQVRDQSGALLLDWSTDAGGITLVNAADGHVQIGPVDEMDCVPGTHYFDFEVQTVNYGTKTLWVGAAVVQPEGTA